MKVQRTQTDSTKNKGPAPDASVTLTNGDRVLFPDAGITKADVFDYYDRIAPRLLPFLRDRPITLERLPAGIGADKPHFWQKNTPTYYPDWIPRIELPTEKGKPVLSALVNDRPTLLYLVNQGVLTFHPWLSRVANLDRPDFVLFDLDPGKADFADSVTVARNLHDILESKKVSSFVKTSGQSGLHVVVPWEQDGTFDAARAWARTIAGRVVEGLPKQATLEISKAKRDRRVYIDVLQNARGHHAVPPYVLRPVPVASVSTPVDWCEVKADLDPKRFNLRTIFARLQRRKREPWASLTARELP
jgi:bifunctional non-homologous end joining protein LigD